MSNAFDELLGSVQEMADAENGLAEPHKHTRLTVVDVATLRKDLGVTQEQLADALDSSVETVKSWESRRRNPLGLAAKILRMIRADLSFYKTLTEA